VSIVLLLFIVAVLNIVGALLSYTCISDDLWRVQQAQEKDSEARVRAGPAV